VLGDVEGDVHSNLNKINSGNNSVQNAYPGTVKVQSGKSQFLRGKNTERASEHFTNGQESTLHAEPVTVNDSSFNQLTTNRQKGADDSKSIADIND